MAVARLRPDETALLVIDVQERLLPAIADRARLVTNVAILVELAALLDLPLLVTEQYPAGLGRTAQAITAAMPDPSRRVEKTRFSACVDLVRDELAEHGARSVLVCGIEAQVCVLQTVLDLAGAGVVPFVVSDAVSAGQRDQIAPALERMRSAGAVVTGVLSAMYELLGDAGHPRFRACLELAKRIET